MKDGKSYARAYIWKDRDCELRDTERERESERLKEKIERRESEREVD